MHQPDPRAAVAEITDEGQFTRTVQDRVAEVDEGRAARARGRDAVAGPMAKIPLQAAFGMRTGSDSSSLVAPRRADVILFISTAYPGRAGSPEP